MVKAETIGQLLRPRHETFVGHPRDYYDFDPSDEDDEMKRWVLTLNTYVEKPTFFERPGDFKRSPPPTPRPRTPDSSGYCSPKRSPKRRSEQTYGDRFISNLIPRDPCSRSLYWNHRADDIRRLKDSIGAKKHGDNRFREGNNMQAIEMYTKAIDICKTFPSDDIMLNRAICYIKVGLHDLAEPDIEHVLSRNRRNIKALFYRAQLYQFRENHTSADNYYIMCFELCHKNIVRTEMINNRLEYLRKEFQDCSKKLDWKYISGKIQFTEDIEEAYDFVRAHNFDRNKVKIKKDEPLDLPEPTMEPLNVFHFNTIWVYNAKCSLKELYHMFSIFGKIIHLSLTPKDDRAAVEARKLNIKPTTTRYSVSFQCPQTASKAIQEMNGVKVSIKGKDGNEFLTKLTVRFMRVPFPRTFKKAECRKWGSCYFWRFTGICKRGYKCPFTHFVPDHKVDRHPLW